MRRAREILVGQRGCLNVPQSQQRARIGGRRRAVAREVDDRVRAHLARDDAAREPLGDRDVEHVARRAGLEIDDRIDAIAPARGGDEHVVFVAGRGADQLAREQPRADLRNRADVARSARRRGLDAEDADPLIVAGAPGRAAEAIIDRAGSAEQQPDRVV